ncbi:TrkH family potassium uptake protein [Candidatus Bipolaricaulota bacterium]|nr:TrkH family potassium uptake protein [Candidatus Bipolaricaulota bacterium]
MKLEDLRVVLRGLGLLVPLVGVMALASMPVALVFGEHYALWPLGATAAISFALGLLLFLPFRGAPEAQLKHGLLIAALGWVLVAALGALPFYLVAQRYVQPTPFRDFTSAFFESVSGYTGTGLTMATRPDLLPKVLQWWRSFIEWVGGMGVIVLMLSILAGPRPSAVTLYFSEARTEKIHPSVISTVRTMWWIFVLYTLASTIGLWSTGMPPWEALNHAMTGISTGGFTVWPDSIGHYHSLAVEIVLHAVMLAGAISFAVHYRAMQWGPKVFLGDVQTRYLILISILGIGALGLENLLRVSPGRAFRDSAFQFVSALSCTGFQTADIHSWSDTAKLILSVAMVIGGAAGSTAGGIKVARFLLLVKGVSWRLRKIVSPTAAVVPLRLGKEVLPDQEASRRLEEAAVLSFLWLGFLFLGVVLLEHLVPPSYTLADVIFEVASAQGNVGLSVGITDPGMPTLGKLLLCFNMWIGRLEIIPILMLFRSLLRGSFGP